MNLRLTEHSADAAEFTGASLVFDTLNEACATYPDIAFRLQSGATVGSYRLAGWNAAGGRTYWIRYD